MFISTAVIIRPFLTREKRKAPPISTWHPSEEAGGAKAGHEERRGRSIPGKTERLDRAVWPELFPHRPYAFGRPNAREILPWLKLSAEMDPKRIDTYVTASYWLRTRLDKPDEAEQFLREGLRANPDSYEILLELGRVYFYNKNNSRVARNILGTGPE